MSDTTGNPYESPQTEAGAVNPLTERALTENMVFYLKGASPWMRFFAIAGFIGLGLAIIIMIIAGIGMGTLAASTPELAAFAMIGPGVIFFYILMLAIYFFPLFFLFRFGKFIKNYMFTNDSRDLEEAFKNNKSLWKFVGILTIIGLAFIALMFVIGIFGAIIGLMAL